MESRYKLKVNNVVCIFFFLTKYRQCCLGHGWILGEFQEILSSSGKKNDFAFQQVYSF